ncbi:MAG: saccharopine dehydrogenase NADP-binding domain-containing protein [Myxococcota bacterium]
MSRSYDIVLFGATGFTGRLVAEYLAQNGPEGLRWALAGRNAEKLERVRSELGLGDVPLEVADAKDREALAALAAKTKVVCTTVGPYAKYGEPLVAACAAAGTHYTDLTGEVQFVRRMIDAHHDTAVASGARIVHCCGFDSIPSDLGCLMVAEALVERGARPTRVDFYAGESSGGFSGGTAASLLNMVEEMKADRDVLRLAANPYALDPDREFRGPDGPDQAGVKFSKDLGMWTGPFVMAGINTRVVRRSHGLRGRPYGPEFRYSEQMSTGKGPQGLARAVALTAGLGGFLASVQIDPIRKLFASRVLPKPGEGPSEEAREAGFFVSRLVARGDKDGQEITVRGKVRGEKDPGYGETAKMLGESALCLAFDEATLPEAAGCLTPATGMGRVLTERLRRAGMTFEVKDA